MVQKLDKENHTTILKDMIEQAELKDKHKHEKSTIEERTTPECEEEHRSRQKVPYKILRGRYTWL